MKQKIFSKHVDEDDFIPASEEEKQYMVKMRPSTTFFKDGMKRLMKNKIAAISMFLIIIIALGSIIIPFFWPYRYDKMLGNTPGKPMDPSYNNLAPFEYGETEQERIAAGESVFPLISAPMPRVVTTLSGLSTVPASPLLSVSSHPSSC